MTYSRCRITARTFQIITGCRKFVSQSTTSTSLEVDKKSNMLNHSHGCKTRMETNWGAEGRWWWSALLEVEKASNTLNCSYNYSVSVYLDQFLTNLEVERGTMCQLAVVTIKKE
jgi:hypothetical protein